MPPKAEVGRWLGGRVDAFFGPQPSLRDYGYLAMMRRLCQLLSVGGMNSGHPRRIEFLRSLRESERRVLWLLEEWWHGFIKDETLTTFTKGILFGYAIYELYAYQDKQDESTGFEHLLVKDAERELYQRAKTQILETREGEFFGHLRWRVQREHATGRMEQTDQVLTDITAYNGALFRLVRVELLLEACPADTRMSMRVTAGTLAACQRVGNECIGRGLKLIGPPDEGDETREVDMAGQVLRVSIHPQQLADPRTPPKGKGLIYSNWNPGAMVDSCPWLTERMEAGERILAEEEEEEKKDLGARVGAMAEKSDGSKIKDEVNETDGEKKGEIVRLADSSDKDVERNRAIQAKTAKAVSALLNLDDLLWNLQQLDLVGPPYYLWSITDRKTVRVQDLDEAPPYAIVSHTWGRWRIPGQDVAVPGLPWLVPANSRFDVAALPDMLQEAGFPEDHVWIDLFCIPQDRGDTEQQRICRSELVRQAYIFQGASTAVAWLFDVDDWRPVSAALAYLAVEYHNNATTKEHTEQTPLYEMILAASAEHASDRCGLLEGDPYAASHGNGDLTVISWFSSLWTLQESLMRPDMLLLNQRWEPLTVWQVAITLDTIASLVMCRDVMFDDAEMASAGNKAALMAARAARLPPGAREIYTLFSTTGMVQLGRPSPLSALALAGNRVCKHSRSQAIMSVLGATLWFRRDDFRQFSQPEDPKDMIFGLYEPAFINEVFHQMGGDFFLCSNEGATVGKDTIREAAANVENQDPPEPEPEPEAGKSSSNFSVKVEYIVSGSMLPFSPQSASRFLEQTEKEQGLVDHPSVLAWRIGSGSDVWTGFRRGDVYLPTVVIFAANCEWEEEAVRDPGDASGQQQTIQKIRVPPRARPLTGSVQGNAPPSEQQVAGQTQAVRHAAVDIDQWVAKFDMDTYAVVVQSSPTEVRGVLLQGLGEPGLSHGFFVKIGIFDVKDAQGIELPHASKVNWTVL